MKLGNIKPASGSVKTGKRVGRGPGSGLGGTSARGHKGAQSRSGYSKKMGFEGGQMPLQRRIPKFGFNNVFRVGYKAINLDTVQKLAEDKKLSVIDFEVLYSNGLVSKSDKVKLLGRGELTAKVDIKLHACSEAAKLAVEKLGGTVTVA